MNFAPRSLTTYQAKEFSKHKSIVIQIIYGCFCLREIKFTDAFWWENFAVYFTKNVRVIKKLILVGEF